MAEKKVLYILAGKSISCGKAGVKGEGEAVIVGKHISKEAATAFLKNGTLGESAPDIRPKAEIVAEREAEKRESRNKQAVSGGAEKDLDKMSVEQLKAYAESKKYEIPEDVTKKADILAFIKLKDEE